MILAMKTTGGAAQGDGSAGRPGRHRAPGSASSSFVPPRRRVAAPQLRRAVARGLRRARCAAVVGLLGLLGSAQSGAVERTLDLGDMTYVSSRGPVNEVVLDADSARIDPGANVAHLVGVHAVLASQETGTRGRGGLDMTCERGTVDLSTGDFVAEGDVRGTTADGRRFRTQRMRYDHDAAVVTTETPVSIRDQAGTYRGGGFRYWVRENRFQLSKGASIVAQ